MDVVIARVGVYSMLGSRFELTSDDLRQMAQAAKLPMIVERGFDFVGMKDGVAWVKSLRVSDDGQELIATLDRELAVGFISGHMADGTPEKRLISVAFTTHPAKRIE